MLPRVILAVSKVFYSITAVKKRPVAWMAMVAILIICFILFVGRKTSAETYHVLRQKN